MVARAAFANDPRVRLIALEQGGIVQALNTGLEAVSPSCRYVARMDADDVMAPERLGRQLAWLDAYPGTSVVASRVRILRDFAVGEGDGVDASGMERYVAWLNGLAGGDLGREMFVEAPVCHPAVMIRTDVLRTAGGYCLERWTEDHDLWLRLHLAGHRFETLPETLHTWRDHGRRLTRTDARCGTEALLAMKAHYLVRAFGTELRIWGAGRDGRHLARALEREGAEITAFIDVDSRKIGGVRRGQVPVVGLDRVETAGSGPIVVAVGIPSARAEIRQYLDARGLVEGRDYVCAA